MQLLIALVLFVCTVSALHNVELHKEEGDSVAMPLEGELWALVRARDSTNHTDMLFLCNTMMNMQKGTGCGEFWSNGKRSSPVFAELEDGVVILHNLTVDDSGRYYSPQSISGKGKVDRYTLTVTPKEELN